MAGLTWDEKPDSFADVLVGPTDIKAEDFPIAAPKQGRRYRERTAAPASALLPSQRRQQYAQQQFGPFGAFVGLVTEPFARRDW
jgi:hypothetical protein